MKAEKSITAEEFHLLALNLADECQKISYEKFKAVPEDIVRGAVFNIFHDAVILHRSIGKLVFDGWSSSAAILVRTMLDLIVSMVAVLKSKNPPLSAFRYFNASYRQLSRNETYSSEFRRGARGLVRQQIGLLPKENRPAALQFLKEKTVLIGFGKNGKVLQKFSINLVLQKSKTHIKDYQQRLTVVFWD